MTGDSSHCRTAKDISAALDIMELWDRFRILAAGGFDNIGGV
jgi:hypothetical protein